MSQYRGTIEANEKYKDICKQLTKQSQELKKENQYLKNQHKCLHKELYRQDKELQELKNKNKELKKEISELHRDAEHVINNIIVEDIKNEAPEKATQIFRKMLEHLLHDPSIVPDIDAGRRFSESCLCHCKSPKREGISEEDCDEGCNVGKE